MIEGMWEYTVRGHSEVQVRQHVQEYAKTLNKQQPNSTKKGIAL